MSAIMKRRRRVRTTPAGKQVISTNATLLPPNKLYLLLPSQNLYSGSILVLFIGSLIGIQMIMTLTLSHFAFLDPNATAKLADAAEIGNRRSREFDWTKKPERHKEKQQGGGAPWLDRIKVGKLLGSGHYSDTFEVELGAYDHENGDGPKTATGTIRTNQRNETKKEYIVRFTGNWNEEDGWDTKPRASVAVEIANRLSPHPSIPANLYYSGNVPNPFVHGGRLRKGLGDGWFDWALKHKQGRLLKASSFEVEVTERAFQTHKHNGRGNWVLDVPVDKVRCFWRRMFEVMDYVHSRNVVLVDTNMWNFMLQDGRIILFDWNQGRIFHDETISNKSTARRYWGGHQYGLDVRGFGERIYEFLESQKEKKEKGKGRSIRGEGKSFDDVISDSDEELLTDMAGIMRHQDPPPTMMWLLDHHEYFSIEKSDPCILE